MNILFTLIYYLIAYLYINTLIALCLRFYYGNIKVFYAEFDRWIGFYIDRRKNVLYYIFIPCIALKFERRNK